MHLLALFCTQFYAPLSTFLYSILCTFQHHPLTLRVHDACAADVEGDNCRGHGPEFCVRGNEEQKRDANEPAHVCGCCAADVEGVDDGVHSTEVSVQGDEEQRQTACTLAHGLVTVLCVLEHVHACMPAHAHQCMLCCVTSATFMPYCASHTV